MTWRRSSRAWLLGLFVVLAGSAVLAAPPRTGLDRRVDNKTAFIDSVDGASATYGLERVFAPLRFQEPVYLTHAGDGTGCLYVVERRGVVWELAKVADPAKDTPARRKFLDIASRVQSSQGDELGLLSIAFAPDYASSRHVYAFYSHGSLFAPKLGPGTVRNRVARFTAKPGAGGLELDPASEQVLLEVPKNYFNHNGGQLQFGPDRLLYVSTGDGGAGGDVERNGQNLKSLKAKILRIDPSHGAPYAIPADNPFVAKSGARGEVWAYGLRNPWRFSFDRVTGELWCGDVGQDAWEEIDVVTKGANYGWSALEGTHPYNAGVPAPHAVPPVHEYGHSTGSAVIGGYVYRGPRLPGLVGRYIFGDYTSGDVWALRWDGKAVTAKKKLLTDGQLQLASFGEDEKGELYLCSLAGPLYRIVEKKAGPSSFPQKLSETGLFADLPSVKMKAALIPYAVIESLWSDGARKERFLAIPRLEKVTRTSAGGWSFPEGSVVVKHFFKGGAPIETRLLVRAEGVWTGYSYEWDEKGEDAVLLEHAKTKLVAGAPWTFPSRSDCFRCHSPADGVLLGVQTAELNSLYDYSPFGGRKANQLETLAHLGVFTKPLPDPKALPRLVAHVDAHASLAERARSYLHVNCSMCHRPGGGAAATLDLRFGTPLAKTGLLDAAPQAGDLGVAGAKIVKPGRPAESVLWLRMNRRGPRQMPPLGTHEVDQGGVKVIGDWIRSLP